MDSSFIFYDQFGLEDSLKDAFYSIPQHQSHRSHFSSTQSIFRLQVNSKNCALNVLWPSRCTTFDAEEDARFRNRGTSAQLNWPESTFLCLLIDADLWLFFSCFQSFISLNQMASKFIMPKLSYLGKLVANWREHFAWFLAFLLLNLFSILAYIYLITQTFNQLHVDHLSHPPLPVLINTSTCHLKDYPMFDAETRLLYESHQDDDFGCASNPPPFPIRRLNFTWIEIDYPPRSWLADWACYAVEIIRTTTNDGLMFGPELDRSLGRLTNFTSNLTAFRHPLETNLTMAGRWDSLKVVCRKWTSLGSYSRIVPLIQHYHPIANPQPNSTNVILLGIDSISRLNFLRHFPLTKKLLEANGFIPMYGHHKVGTNSYPNVYPMLTGLPIGTYCNQSNHNCAEPGYKFDHLPLIFKEAHRQGYMSGFVEDMPEFGFFTPGGFIRQPTHYYLRATNMAIVDELYREGMCYQERLEFEVYFDFLLDLFAAFKHRHQPFITFTQLSTLTHPHLNYAGYVDAPFHHFLRRFLEADHHRNSVILLYSDHAVRNGRILNTRSNLYESRLPFFYVYVPHSLTLNGLDADQLREIARTNQHRLTSHFDIHATMMHVLTGGPPSHQFGVSLFAPIPLNRTCSSAGIPAQFCLCNTYQQIEITSRIVQYSQFVVRHMNHVMASEAPDQCLPLAHSGTVRAFSSCNAQLNESHVEVHFRTAPNSGQFTAMVRLTNEGEVQRVEHITRTNIYGHQSHCVGHNKDLKQFCLCWDVYREQQRSGGRGLQWLTWLTKLWND